MARESEQASQQKIQTALSFGATIMGALLGRKAVSAGTLGRATTAARGVGRTMKETSDVKRASETVEAVRAQVRELEEQLREETQTLAAAFDRAGGPRAGHASAQARPGDRAVRRARLGSAVDAARSTAPAALASRLALALTLGACRRELGPRRTRGGTRRRRSAS